MEKLINKMFTVLDAKTPKTEIRHILVDSENIVCTDTKFILCVEHKMNISESILLQNSKAATLTGVSFNCDFDMLAAPEAKNGKYPDYKRILTKEDYTLLDDSKSKLSILEAIYAIQNVYPIAFTVALLSTLKKLDQEVQVTGYVYKEQRSPLYLKLKTIDGKIGYLAIMPAIYELRIKDVD